MGLLRLSGFAGMWPIRDVRGLPDNAAVEAENIRVEGGAYLRGLPSPVFVKNLNALTKSVFRIPLAGANTLVNSYWMEFADINTDVQFAPIVNDSYKRIYWCSPTSGLRYAPQADILTGSLGKKVGVTPPATAPTLAADPDSGAIDVYGDHTGLKVTKSYVATFVTTMGEESQPGPPREIVIPNDQYVIVTNIPQPVANADKTPIQYVRLYRTVTGQNGQGFFYKVADVPVGTTTINDNLSDSIVTGLGAIESVIWAEPPADLQGLVALPNGIFAGWSGRNVYFSENYRPHAWPAEYTMTVDFPVVGMGVVGNALVVCTEGNPVVISGVKAASMTMTKIEEKLPCMSRRSIVSTKEGVAYSTINGVVFIGPGVPASLMTEQLFARDDWRANYAPETHKCMFVNGYLITAYTDPAGQSDAFSFKPSNISSVGVSKIDISGTIVNLGVEPWTGKPFIIGGDAKLYEYEVPNAAPLTYTWRSKEFKYPQPTNFGVYQAYFDPGNAGLCHLRAWVTLRGNDGGTSRVLVYDADIAASGREIRFPSGFKSDIWEFEFTGTAPLQEFLIATSVKELRGA